MFEGGGKSLLDHELVEYLLALTIKRIDTKPIAKRLISQFGGVGQLLGADVATLRREGLSDASIGALKIAEASALRLLETRVEGRPMLSSWEALGDYLQAAMAHSPVEEVRILFLNARNMLLANEAMWRGSVDEAPVHVREVIGRAIQLGASDGADCAVPAPERSSDERNGHHSTLPRRQHPACHGTDPLCCRA